MVFKNLPISTAQSHIRQYRSPSQPY